MPPEETEAMEEVRVRTAPVSRDWASLYLPIAIVLAGALVGRGLFFGLSRGGSSGAQTGPTPAKVNIKDVKTAGEPFIGPANAKVVLAFWADFQCPFCKAVETGGVPQITTPAAIPDLIKMYVDTGKMRIVFKDYPFLGKDSITGGEYARAVWDLYPAQYFAFRTAMYNAQDAEGDTGFGNAVSIDKLIKTKFSQMDGAKIKQTVAANKAKYDTAMDADRVEGTSFGVQGTPAFITGTTLIDGAQALSAFTTAIDAQLK